MNVRGRFHVAPMTWRALFSLILMAVLVLPLLGLTPLAPAGSLSRIQPELLAFSQQRPQSRVGVIVQRAAGGAVVEAAITRLGGSVTTDLPIVNAVAAELPARAVVQLGRVAGIGRIWLDAPASQTNGPDGPVDTRALTNAYIKAINADSGWQQGYQGSGITVAVVDSGWTGHDDFLATRAGGNTRVQTAVSFSRTERRNTSDTYGHGTHVAGVIGGNGSRSGGKFIGVAPRVDLVSVKVGDKNGQGTISGVLEGLQWIYNNREQYNIRVVNISLTTDAEGSYHENPLDAAVEVLWFHNIVVVVSAGNTNTPSGEPRPPANDPFVITVGAMDDKGTATIADDTLASFSAYGQIASGHNKPDLVAPGRNIIAPLAGANMTLAQSYPTHLVAESPGYFRMSGTSMSAPMVAGAAALLLQAEPNLTPDQVKFRLMTTARKVRQQGTGAGYLDIAAALRNKTTQSANTGLAKSQMIWGTPSNPEVWDSASWGSASWGSASWGSDHWGE